MIIGEYLTFLAGEIIGLSQLPITVLWAERIEPSSRAGVKGLSVSMGVSLLWV